MYIDIVTQPERTVFSGEVDSVTVPGSKGEFQMLNQHDAIVSTLTRGKGKDTHSPKSRYSNSL